MHNASTRRVRSGRKAAQIGTWGRLRRRIAKRLAAYNVVESVATTATSSFLLPYVSIVYRSCQKQEKTTPLDTDFDDCTVKKSLQIISDLHVVET